MLFAIALCTDWPATLGLVSPTLYRDNLSEPLGLIHITLLVMGQISAFNVDPITANEKKSSVFFIQKTKTIVINPIGEIKSHNSIKILSMCLRI